EGKLAWKNAAKFLATVEPQRDPVSGVPDGPPRDVPRLTEREQISSHGSELKRGDEVEPETGWHQAQINQCRHCRVPRFASQGALLRLLACENERREQSG